MMTFIDKPDDLSELQIIDADKLRQFVDSLNNLTHEDIADRKLVIGIGTGGTISMMMKNGIRAPALNMQEILSHVNSNLSDMFYVHSFDAFRIDSADMHYGHVRDLAIALTYIWNNAKQDSIGFLITHGTDTLSYSSAAMSLIMGQGLPFSIVYAASQKSLNEPMNDVSTNIRNALFTLESLHQNDMAEVVITVGDYAMLATSAEKTDDLIENAFSSPLHKYVAAFSKLQYPIPLAGWLNSRRKVTFAPTIWREDSSHTLIVKSTLGLSPDMIGRFAADDHVHAVLWYSYGTDAVDVRIGRTLMKVAQEKTIPVYIVSPVNSQYIAAYESGAEMLKNGVISLDMTIPAALAKIEISLRKFPNDPQAQAKFMQNNYVGEVPSEETRFVAMH